MATIQSKGIFLSLVAQLDKLARHNRQGSFQMCIRDSFMPVWQPSRCSRWLFWWQGRQHYHAVAGYFYVGS